MLCKGLITRGVCKGYPYALSRLIQRVMEGVRTWYRIALPAFLELTCDCLTSASSSDDRNRPICSKRC